nr:immunoglobulin light chain junction region [Macaca mulatta]
DYYCNSYAVSNTFIF